MASDPETTHALNAISVGISELKTSQKENRDENRQDMKDARSESQERNKGIHKRIDEVTLGFNTIQTTLNEVSTDHKVLKQAHKGHVEQTDTKFKNVWRWLGPLGGLALAAGGAANFLKLSGG